MSHGRRGFKPILAHRVSWQIHFGEIPNGKCVLHRCDNTACIRPDHLFLGTKKENTHDIMKKERGHWQKKAPHKLIALKAAERTLVEL